MVEGCGERKRWPSSYLHASWSDHDLHDHVTLVVRPARHGLERLLRVLQSEPMRDEAVDVELS